MKKIAGASLNQTALDWEGNFSNMVDAIEAARLQGVTYLCLPELCITGYGCEDWFLSDYVCEKALAQALKLLPYTAGMFVAAGLPVKAGNRRYNGMAVLCDKKMEGITLKHHLPKEGVHYEPRWFESWPSRTTDFIAAGDAKIPVGDIIYSFEGLKIGFEICEDAWHGPARTGYYLRERNAALIFCPSASHFSFGKNKIREELAVSGSALFNCTYLHVNMLGNEAGRMIYDGDIIVAHQGKAIRTQPRFSFKRFQLLTHVIGENKVIAPASALEKNEEFAKAASLALFDYLRKSHSKGFVISLSGGADSACCAVLVSEMARRGTEELGEEFGARLGIENLTDIKKTVGQLLTCAYQSSRHSGAQTLYAAKTLALSIGAEFHHWSIEEETASYEEKISRVLKRPVAWETDDIAKQNLQARSRSPAIWMLANIKKALLLTTSNRSEGDVGYATMDGDTSGSIAPILGVDKPFIQQWLRWAEETLGYQGLHEVNQLEPAAELRPNDRHQTDEKDLMPYPILLAIEKLAIKQRLSPIQAYEKLKDEFPPDNLKNHIAKFYKLWAANQWKRDRMPPSFHYDDLNIDPRSWCRFPLLSGGFKEELEELMIND